MTKPATGIEFLPDFQIKIFGKIFEYDQTGTTEGIGTTGLATVGSPCVNVGYKEQAQSILENWDIQIPDSGYPFLAVSADEVDQDAPGMTEIDECKLIFAFIKINSNPTKFRYVILKQI